MRRGSWILAFIVGWGSMGALAQPAQPRHWTGVKGADPASLQAPEGCFLYKDYVVLEKPTQDDSGNDVIVKDRRKLAPKATAAQLCADDGQNVLLKRPNEDSSYFAGIYQGLLLIDSGTGEGRSLVVHALADGKKLTEVYYRGEYSVRVLGTSLYFFDYVDVKSKKCEPSFFKNEMSEQQCRKEAHALWQCIQRDAAPRLDATPNPFSHSGAFDDTNKGNQCQLSLMEQSRLDLKTMTVTPTGHVWAMGLFIAAG
ncbi:MAG TPA: hypothetical protein VF815_05250 [Myxococcaceae bacterium]|jgi:hypothetical protein